MATHVDLQLIEGLGLPYAPGAEAGLLDPALDPLFDAAWQQFLALFPGQTLFPLFDELPVEELADLVDGVRVSGEEAPNPFVWFTLTCDDEEADDIVAALLALPMAVFAGRRPIPALAEIISYGTNPRVASGATRQIQPSPIGIDAIYAWQVAGGAGDGIRIADVEHGWGLNHEELITANITRRSTFGAPSAREVDHGTGVAGILVGADNGAGTVGIVPNTALDLVSEVRAGGQNDLANAIAFAARQLTRGDVLLIELGTTFFPVTPNPTQGDVVVEIDPAVQLQIALAVRRGITVIEPAGNGGINLDQFPALAHTRPESPTFSGAVVVGSAQDTEPPSGAWHRLSSFGSRVDCFAAGSKIQSPAASAADAYQEFSGTSGASAIIAGVAASLQAMTLAATNGRVLAPADIRRLFSSATLGTLPVDPLGSKIGSMPSLRAITQAQGLPRILPVGAAAIEGDALLMVHLDAENRIVRRFFTLLTGWGPAVPTITDDGSQSDSDFFELTPAQPAVTSASEDDPILRVVHHAFFSGPGGIHRMFWDTLNESGDVSKPIAPRTAAAQGHALAAVRPRELLVVFAAINPEGRLVVLNGDPQILLSSTSAPTVIDPVGMYRRLAGPAMVTRGPGVVDIVAIEDGGALNWLTGVYTDPPVPLFAGPFTESSATQFDPGARPALLSTGSLLLAAGVGADGSLRVATIHPLLIAMDTPIEVDASVPIARSGPVALGRAGNNVVVAAVDTQNAVRAATRPISGGDWTPLVPLFSLTGISPLGGVTLVSIDSGVMAIAVDIDGGVNSALSVDGIVWSPMLPLP